VSHPAKSLMALHEAMTSDELLKNSLCEQMAPVGAGYSQSTVCLEHLGPLLMKTFIPLDNSEALLEPELALYNTLEAAEPST